MGPTLARSPQATMTESAISYNRLSSLSYKMAGPHLYFGLPAVTLAGRRITSL